MAQRSDSGSEFQQLGSPGDIGLCLSGGGFRATIYHLGVISCLRDHGLLHRLKVVTGVSGGSVLAGHLAKEWNRYNGTVDDFASVADELLGLMALDLRGRVVRRWSIGSLLILPRLFGFLTFHALTSRTLDRLYDKAKIGVLKGGSNKPSFHILSTSMTTGHLCKFTHDRFSVIPDSGNESHTACSEVLLSVAVSASAAFPPLFPPVPVSYKTLDTDQSRFPNTQYLTDGGIYDNLGLQELWRLTAGSNFAALLISDAGGNFDWSLGKRYKGVFSRNVRATDIIMDRVSKLVPSQLIGKGSPLVQLYIGTTLSIDECIWGQSPEIQTAIRNTRTDLDAFSETEILAIARHAYSVTTRQLFDSGLTSVRATPTWQKIADEEHLVPLKKLRKTSKRRLRLVAWKDWAFYGLIALVIGWFWFIPGPSDKLKDWYMEQFQRDVFISINVDNSSKEPFSGSAILVRGDGPFNTSENSVVLNSRGDAYLTGYVPYNGYFFVAVEPPNTSLTIGVGHSAHILMLKVRRGKLEEYEGESGVETFYSGLRLTNPQYGAGLHIRVSYSPEALGFK